MYDEKQTNETEINPCADCEYFVDLKQQRLRLGWLLQRTCDALEKRLTDPEAGKPSPTIGDYLKILQYAREVEKETAEEQGPREIKYTWVDPESKGR